jgi:hypothetical protein
MLAHANKSHKMDIYKGRKLDSVTILEYCTHRELTDDDVQAVVDGTLKPELIPVRDIGNVSQSTTPKIAKDIGSVVQSPAPKAAKLSPPGVTSVQLPADDDDRPYDWLQRFPTIVLRRDGQWVELRCDICGVCTQFHSTPSPVILILDREIRSPTATKDTQRAWSGLFAIYPGAIPPNQPSWVRE